MAKLKIHRQKFFVFQFRSGDFGNATGWGHGLLWCQKTFPNETYECGNNFETFKKIVEVHQTSMEYLTLDQPKTVILTNEDDPLRLEQMEKLGWLLFPCLANNCPQINERKNRKYDNNVTQLEQLVAEIAVVCESQKAILNMASTFWSIIKQLHVRGTSGIEMMKRV